MPITIEPDTDGREVVTATDPQLDRMQALVDKAQLYATISIDSSDDAEESITELTALLNKSATVKVDKTPARNEPCSCGSGKKYKKCCG